MNVLDVPVIYSNIKKKVPCGSCLTKLNKCALRFFYTKNSAKDEIKLLICSDGARKLPLQKNECFKK